MLKIISQEWLQKPEQAKPKSWLAHMFTATQEPPRALDLSTMKDYLKTEDLEATARELRRLLSGVRTIRLPLDNIEMFLNGILPKTTKELILIETVRGDAGAQARPSGRDGFNSRPSCEGRPGIHWRVKP